MSTILFVDDVKTLRDQFAYDLQRLAKYKVLTAAHGRDALKIIQQEDVDAMVLDLEMPVMDGLTLLKVMVEEAIDDIPVLVYTGKGDFQSCVQAIRLGAYNFFDKHDVNVNTLIHAIGLALQHRKLLLKNRALRRAARKDSPIIGESVATQNLRSHISRVAEVPSNVLISGESGTGKELVAREIHRLSPQSKQQFVPVNCAAIPDNLVESELFGFEKGAFSGAHKTQMGKFELASGGTIFLDEIGDMPLAAQAKLLRVLQEGEISRIGGEGRIIKINTRVVTATHRNLEELIEQGLFRRDLYYRICTHIIAVPALRDRIQDVDALAVYFSQRICTRFGKKAKLFHPKTLDALRGYQWRLNNVRELENVVERTIIQCQGEKMLPEHFPADLDKSSGVKTGSGQQSFHEMKEDAERNILISQLKANNWHITNTAKALGISNHSNLLKMMRRLGIQRPK